MNNIEILANTQKIKKDFKILIKAIEIAENLRSQGYCVLITE
jgi:hypothetical protein